MKRLFLFVSFCLILIFTSCTFECHPSEHDFVISGISEKDEQVYVSMKCSICHLKEDVPIKDTALRNIPHINILGSISEASKENKVKVQIKYHNGSQDFYSYATLKVQGATSASFPKKNYNIQLYEADDFDKKNKVILKDEWGKQSKYCLKANWVDYSQSRNIVTARLFGKIVASRDYSDGLEKAPNGGGY